MQPTKPLRPHRIGQIVVDGNKFDIVQTMFPNGRVALLIQRGLEPYSRLAVNVPQAEIGPHEFFARTYEENYELRGPLLASGLFEDTGKRIKSGFVSLELWRLRQTAPFGTRLH